MAKLLVFLLSPESFLLPAPPHNVLGSPEPSSDRSAAHPAAEIAWYMNSKLVPLTSGVHDLHLGFSGTGAVPEFGQDGVMY